MNNNQQNHHQQQQQQQQNMLQMGGPELTRNRSAQSSYFADPLYPSTTGAGFGAAVFDPVFNPQVSSSDTQNIFSTRFINNSDTVQENRLQLNSQHLLQKQLQRQQSNEYSSVMYQDITSSSGMENSSIILLGSNGVAQMKMESGGSGLIRHSSSPAGLFANMNIEKVGAGKQFGKCGPNETILQEFGAMRGMGNYGAGNTSIPEASSSSASRFNTSTDVFFKQLDEDHGNFIRGFPINSWDVSAILSDNFLNDNKLFSSANATADQNNQNRQTTRLSHHLSMPTSSSDFSAMESLLNDSIPCKLRAKRGFATHPRSIAERVRRTKISDRMKKLQEFVPNMEKQTNTSDMLDLAVDYIKDLQNEVTKLSNVRTKCSCSARRKS